MMARRTAGFVFVAVLANLLTGCVSSIMAPKIVTAPNRSGNVAGFFGNSPETRLAITHVYAHTLTIPVSPPEAEIAASVIEPGDYHHEHTLTIQRGEATKPQYFVNTRWDPLSPDVPRLAPRGTIVLLHGFWMSRETVLHWGIHLAQAGYRTVLVDLRGHGASTGAWTTFGAVETSDLSQVLDELQKRGLAGDRVGVLGISYGAAIGLHWAARDARVETVVALAPFSDPQIAIRQYARAMLSPAANKALSDRSIAASTRKAAKLAEFSWSDADVRRSVPRLTIPVLFIHGLKDTILPIEHSRVLQRLAPPGSRLIETQDDDHFSLSMRLDGIAEPVVAWFEQSLTGGSNPSAVAGSSGGGEKSGRGATGG